MGNLTVAEKTHWRDRIQARLDRRIEAVAAADPGFLDRIRQEARGRALKSLGLAGFQAELDRITTRRAELDAHDTRIRKEMLAKVRGVPADELDGYTRVHDHPEIRGAIDRRRAVHEEELLGGHELGRQVLRLRAEKERLLDTVWLACSPAQIRQLWSSVGRVLGEEPTALEREALSIAPAGEEG